MLLTVRFLLSLLLLASCQTAASDHGSPLSDQEFVALSLDLSEPDGYFDTDNLISNETSYQHVIPALRETVAPGGAYLGVGPDQNFTYIAHTRPAIALMIDIRRDNLLQHLYFKQLFTESRNRVEFLSNLLGKPIPLDFNLSEGADALELCRVFRTLPSDPDFFEGRIDSYWAALQRRFGPLLKGSDQEDLARLTDPFFLLNLDLRFTSHGRPPRRSYPTFEELLTETDLRGKQRGFLASEASYQVVRALQRSNRIIPVIGNLAGPTSLARIAEYLKANDYSLSAFYTSNVEFYLFNNFSFQRFAENLGRLPVDSRSLLIRSYFSYWRQPHPETVPGYPVTSMLQPVEEFLKRNQTHPYREYQELVFSGFIPIATRETVH